jgi:hypothetical protein
MSGANQYTLKLSETAKVRPGFLRSSISVVYAGMLSESIYSVVVTWSSGHNSMAYNLYMPMHQKEFFTPIGHVQVDFVSPEEIHFEYFET